MKAEKIALALFAALGLGYLAIVLIQRTPEERALSRLELPHPDEVRGVDIRREGQTVSLSRETGGWQVSDGENRAGASQLLVEALLEGLAGAATAPPTRETASFGAIRQVVLHLAGGGELSLDVGRRRPGGHGCSAAVGEARLSLPSTVDWLLDRPAAGWTRGLAWDLDVSHLAAVELTGMVRVKASRDEQGWTVNGERASSRRVETWLSYLTRPPVLEPVSKPASVLPLAGKIRLDDGAEHSFSCGEGILQTDSSAWRTDDVLCLRLATTPQVLVGAPLLRSPITRIELDHGNTRWTLGSDGEGWMLQDPANQHADSNQARLVALYLTDLAPLPVGMGAPLTAFDSWATITVTNDGGRQVLRLGKPDNRGMVPAVVDGGSPVLLERFQVDPILLPLNELTAE